MGVWIETMAQARNLMASAVTPYVGVWIETIRIRSDPNSPIVTPYVGVWIETQLALAPEMLQRHTLRGCVD